MSGHCWNKGVIQFTGVVPAAGWACPLIQTLGNTKTKSKRMRTQQTKLTQHRFAQPEKISQPWAQPRTPSPAFATASASLTAHVYRTAQRGTVPPTARTRGREDCRAHSTQRHGISFCKHHHCATVSACISQPNPPLNLTACKLRLQVPVALRAPAAG